MLNQKQQLCKGFFGLQTLKWKFSSQAHSGVESFKARITVRKSYFLVCKIPIGLPTVLIQRDADQ